MSKYNETATYWPPTTTRDRYGNIVFGSPAALVVRWQNKRDIISDPTGNQIASQAVVYPQQELELGGYLFYGTSVAADPTTLRKAFKILNHGRSKNLQATKTVYKVWL